jgi:hypothetical protein
MNFTSWWAQNEPSERHLDDWTHADLREFARKAWEAAAHDQHDAFSILAPICRDCDRPLTVDDVLANEQPGEDGVWLHTACSDEQRAALRADADHHRREELSGAQ